MDVVVLPFDLNPESCLDTLFCLVNQIGHWFESTIFRHGQVDKVTTVVSVVPQDCTVSSIA